MNIDDKICVGNDILNDARGGLYVLVLHVFYVKKIPCFFDFLEKGKIVMGAPVSLPIFML